MVSCNLYFYTNQLSCVTRALSVSPALLAFSLSHLLLGAGAGVGAAAAAASAAAQNSLFTTRNEAILTEFNSLVRSPSCRGKHPACQEDSSHGAKMASGW